MNNMTCEGPLIWYSVNDVIPGVIDMAGILHCAGEGCGFIVITTGFMDKAHLNTPIMQEGYAM